MRDEDAAREFAVKWSTRSKGEIANLAGCYLRALDEIASLRAQLSQPERYVRAEFGVDFSDAPDQHEHGCPLYDDGDWNSATRQNYYRAFGKDPACTCKPPRRHVETQCADTCCGVRCRLPTNHPGKHEWAAPERPRGAQ